MYVLIEASVVTLHSTCLFYPINMATQINNDILFIFPWLIFHVCIDWSFSDVTLHSTCLLL